MLLKFHRNAYLGELLSLFLFSDHLKMADRPQRSLRPRKPYPYLPPDTEDPDHLGYARLNFNKVSMAGRQDAVSPAMELNSNAKILVRFFNSVNKAVRQCKEMEGEDNRLPMKGESMMAEKHFQKNRNTTEAGRKIGPSKKDPREDQNKKEKEMHYARNAHYQADLPKNPSKADIPSHKQTYPHYQPHLTHQFGYENLLQQINSKAINFNQIFPQNNLEAASKASIQQFLLFNQSQLLSGKSKVEGEVKQVPQQKSQTKESKLFGRSAYHVAIAYHIHLKKIRQNGEEMINSANLDPTFNARKLKGGEHLG